MTQWEAPPEEKATTPPPSSEAITTPVTRTVVDESESFFSAFLSSGDVQGVTKSLVVSVPPTKSQRRQQEKENTNEEAVIQTDTNTQKSEPDDMNLETQVASEDQLVKPDSSPSTPYAETILLQPVSPVSSSADLPGNPDNNTSCVNSDDDLNVSVDSKTEQSKAPSEQQAKHDAEDSSKPCTLTSEPKTSTPSDPLPSPSSKEVLLEHKDSKVEDRQNETPSPPVSAFSSGTSTTSDIEVLDHESVLSESSASSRQEPGEGKSGLHLMQGSFQLLTASTCGDFPRLEDYPKLTESCGSSSDAFERIDSFSVQSLDSRSVSEVNSDDEIPGSRTLASVTAGPAPLTVSSVACQKQEGRVVDNVGEEQEAFPEMMSEQSLDEMEESGRSATPVNSEQPEELTEQEQESEANIRLSDPSSCAGEEITPITEEMKSVSTVQILQLQKVTAALETLYLVVSGYSMIIFTLLNSHGVVKHYHAAFLLNTCRVVSGCSPAVANAQKMLWSCCRSLMNCQAASR